MSKTKKSATQERFTKEATERGAKMAKQKAAREAAEANASKLEARTQGMRMVAITDIHVGKRLRALTPEKVAEVAASMASVGQLAPIVVREPNHHTDTIKAKYVLLAGLHRLQAATSLGWSQIQATVLDYGDCADIDAAALVEIDENLCRAELEPAERAAHIGRRKELYEKLHPETKHGAAPGKAGGGKTKGVPNTSFANATVKATGRSKSAIEKDAKRAKVLGKLLDRVNGGPLDTAAELDALCKLSEEEREDLVARAEAGEKVSVKAALAAKKSKPPTAAPGAPVTRSAERSIEQVQAEFADEAPAIAGSDEIDANAREAADDAMRAGETPPADEPPSCKAGAGDTSFGALVNEAVALLDEATALIKTLLPNEVLNDIQFIVHWAKEPDYSGAMKKLAELRELLPKLATPSKSKLH
jgi:ParB/RepB/Spo0J family partition protein